MTDLLTRSQSAAVERARRPRSIAIAVVCVALAALFYALAFVKLAGH